MIVWLRLEADVWTSRSAGAACKSLHHKVMKGHRTSIKTPSKHKSWLPMEALGAAQTHTCQCQPQFIVPISIKSGFLVLNMRAKFVSTSRECSYVIFSAVSCIDFNSKLDPHLGIFWRQKLCCALQYFLSDWLPTFLITAKEIICLMSSDISHFH